MARQGNGEVRRCTAKHSNGSVKKSFVKAW